MRTSLEIRQLEAFVATARTLNMARTAEALGLTPSGVSRSLKTLETELGCRLFERTTRHMALAPAGHELLPRAEELLGRLKEMQERLRVWSELRNGRLRLGVAETVGQFVLPPALREFRESFPGHTVTIEVCPAAKAAALLAEARIDLALLPEPVSCGGAEFRSLAEDDLLFVVHPLHPWAIARRVTRDAIAEARLVLPASGDATRELVAAYFQREGIELRPFVEIANEEAIKSFVRLDLGVGILPRWLVEEEVEQGLMTTLPLGRKRLRRRWGVLYPASRELGFAESLLVRLCRNVLRELVARHAETERP